MKKYCIHMIEKIFYEVYVDANSETDAIEKATEAFENGDESVEVTDQYVDHIDAEEEAE